MIHKNDFDDVENPMRHDFVLSAITNALAAIGAFVLGIGIWLWWWMA